MEMHEVARSYLRQPYARLVVPETDGTYRAEILEFPGCLATGDTSAEALSSLEDAAEDWLLAALERGQPIPQPVECTEFSGKFVLRLPKSLHKKAARLAERDGVSLNQFIVAAVATHVGETVSPRAFLGGGPVWAAGVASGPTYYVGSGTSFGTTGASRALNTSHSVLFTLDPATNVLTDWSSTQYQGTTIALPASQSTHHLGADTDIWGQLAQRLSRS